MSKPKKKALDISQLNEVIRQLKTGEVPPRRVLVNEDGYATTAKLALRDYDVVAAIAFVRYDGWTLGAPLHLADVAATTWGKEWVATAIPLPKVQPNPSPN